MRGSLDKGGSYGKGRMSRLSLKTLLGNGARHWAANHLLAEVPKRSRLELQLGGGNPTLTERLHTCSPVGECHSCSPLLFQSGTLLPRVSGRHWRDKGDGNRAWVIGWRIPSCHGPHIWEAQGPAPLRPHLASFFLQACWAAQWDPGSHPPIISQCHCRHLHLKTRFPVLRTSRCFLEEALVVLGGTARWARQKGDGGG